MRKPLAVLITALIVGAGVWYLAARVPLAAPGPAARATSAPGSASAPATAPPLGATCGGHCGTERWDVKTLSDPDRAAVSFTPVDATVEQLAALPVAYPPRGHERGVPAEVTTYRVDALLTRMFTEDDHDWHLVLHGLQDEQASIIAEIPDPQCAGACRSGFAADYARARAALEARVAHASLRRHPIRVRVTGVGFFDRLHGQAGVAPNGFELHPVLAIAFLP